MAYEKNDLVKITSVEGEEYNDSIVGLNGRVVASMNGRVEISLIDYPNSHMDFAESNIEDVYEYERESGHYGLTPKGIQPPSR